MSFRAANRALVSECVRVCVCVCGLVRVFCVKMCLNRCASKWGPRIVPLRIMYWRNTWDICAKLLEFDGWGVLVIEKEWDNECYKEGENMTPIWRVSERERERETDRQRESTEADIWFHQNNIVRNKILKVSLKHHKTGSRPKVSRRRRRTSTNNETTSSSKTVVKRSTSFCRVHKDPNKNRQRPNKVEIKLTSIDFLVNFWILSSVQHVSRES